MEMIERFETSFTWIKSFGRRFSSLKNTPTSSATPSFKIALPKGMFMPGGEEELVGVERPTNTIGTFSGCSSQAGTPEFERTGYEWGSDHSTPKPGFKELDWPNVTERKRAESMGASFEGVKRRNTHLTNFALSLRGIHEMNMSPGFPFMKLPLEIRLSILEYCAPIPSERRGANSMDTFLTLLRVSKAVQYEAYTACLPHTALALWTKKGVRSFRALLQRQPMLGCRVRYLWLGTGKYDEEELGWAVDVLKVATQLRSFACGEFLFSRVVKSQALAETCERVTLMNVEKGVEYEVRGVKQLRLCAGAYSTKEKFPGVESLCFNARRKSAVRDERVRIEYEAVDRWLETLGRFAMVERDGRRVSERGLGIKFAVKREGKPDMFSVVLPTRWTEWDIWSADATGTGIWDLCRMPIAK